MNQKIFSTFLYKKLLNWTDCLLIFAILNYLKVVRLDKKGQIWFASKSYVKKADVSGVTEVDPSKEISGNIMICIQKITNLQIKARSWSKRA